MRMLYNNQTATVRTEYGDCETFNIEKGVRQGCILSPYLFNLYSEAIMRNLEELDEGVNIGGTRINNLRYADDTTLLAESKEDLITLIRKVKEESEKMGLYLNIKKTKVMATMSLENISIDNQPIEIVKNFTFLGSRIDKSADCSKEIRQRLLLG